MSIDEHSRAPVRVGFTVLQLVSIAGVRAYSLYRSTLSLSNAMKFLGIYKLRYYSLYLVALSTRNASLVWMVIVCHSCKAPILQIIIVSSI